MNKLDFMATLRERLSGLPQDEIEERLNFYSEMIDDRMEEGLTEKEAIAELGTIEEIAAQVMAEIPLAKLVKEKVKPNRQLKTWEVVLLALGSPIWFSLIIAAVCVVFALYAAIWSLMIALWAVEFTVAASAVGFVLGAVVVMTQGNMAAAIALLGAALVCAGFAILLHYASKLSLKGILALSRKMFIAIKSCFVKREAA